MKKFVLLIVPAILLNLCLSAQKQQVIVVKAGTKLLDYFTVEERYLYSEFTTGKILLKNGNYSAKNSITTFLPVKSNSSKNPIHSR